ncbi:hypothetical protein ACLOJK_013527 [Asimina triloba]
MKGLKNSVAAWNSPFDNVNYVWLPLTPEEMVQQQLNNDDNSSKDWKSLLRVSDSQRRFTCFCPTLEENFLTCRPLGRMKAPRLNTSYRGRASRKNSTNSKWVLLHSFLLDHVVFQAIG